MKNIDVLNLVLSKGGLVTLDKTVFPKSWRIRTIKAVEFTEEAPEDCWDDEDPDKWPWNMYVQRIREAIGTFYCSWIRDADDKYRMKGIIACFDDAGEEIKLKHFEEYPKYWNKLYNALHKAI